MTLSSPSPRGPQPSTVAGVLFHIFLFNNAKILKSCICKWAGYGLCTNVMEHYQGCCGIVL